MNRPSKLYPDCLARLAEQFSHGNAVSFEIDLIDVGELNSVEIHLSNSARRFLRRLHIGIEQRPIYAAVWTNLRELCVDEAPFENLALHLLYAAIVALDWQPTPAGIEARRRKRIEKIQSDSRRLAAALRLQAEWGNIPGGTIWKVTDVKNARAGSLEKDTWSLLEDSPSVLECVVALSLAAERALSVKPLIPRQSREQAVVTNFRTEVLFNLFSRFGSTPEGQFVSIVHGMTVAAFDGSPDEALAVNPDACRKHVQRYLKSWLAHDAKFADRD